MHDIRQSPTYAKYQKATGWTIKEKNGVYYFIKSLPLIGSVIKLQRPDIIDYTYIDRLTREFKTFQVIVEPSLSSNCQPLLSKNYKISSQPYLPSKTIQLDLSKNSEDLFKYFKKDAKYAIRKNNKLPIKKYRHREIDIFHKLWKKSVPLRRYVPSLNKLKIMKKIFESDSLFITDQEGSSGGVFLKTDKICYYWHAFTNKEGRRMQSQYKIVWQGIEWAKKTGCRIFDFEGIYDERFPNQNWKGFTHFKKSFGGYEVLYPGAFVKNNLLELFKL